MTRPPFRIYALIGWLALLPSLGLVYDVLQPEPVPVAHRTIAAPSVAPRKPTLAQKLTETAQEARRPVVTPKPRPAPVQQISYAPGTVQAQLVALWPGDDRVMLCIVAKETGRTWNPNIKSRTGKYWGLFQADSAFRADYGWAGWGVAEQVAMAWRGYQARGWGPWPTRRGCL